MRRTLGHARRVHSRLVVVALVGSAACAHRPDAAGPRADLVAVQIALIMANNAADAAAVERLTADEWIGISASGVSTTKPQIRSDLAARGAARVQATPQQLAQRQKEWLVRIYGDVGIVTRLTAGDHGAPAWVTTTWVRRDGRWQRVLSQTTQAPVEQ